MTREERAIANLKQMCSDGRYLGSGSYAPLEVLEDFSIAIKALEQEPTTKNDLSHNLCDSCTNIRCEFQSGIVRTKCAFYMPPQHSSGLEKNSKKLEKDFGESDCISRQSVLDKIQRLIDAEQNNIDENGDYMNYARERVNAYEGIQFFVENDCLCPSVTPQEPRKGHWISRWHAGHDLHFHVCSECNEEFSCDMETGIGIDDYSFCPNCGADMREVEE